MGFSLAAHKVFMKASRYYFNSGVIFIRGLVLLLCIAPSFLHAKEKWQQREQEKDITVYSQKIDGSGAARLKGVLSVSYTHLTLPTICSV